MISWNYRRIKVCSANAIVLEIKLCLKRVLKSLHVSWWSHTGTLPTLIWKIKDFVTNPSKSWGNRWIQICYANTIGLGTILDCKHSLEVVHFTQHSRTRCFETPAEVFWKNHCFSSNPVDIMKLSSDQSMLGQCDRIGNKPVSETSSQVVTPHLVEAYGDYQYQKKQYGVAGNRSKHRKSLGLTMLGQRDRVWR